MLDIVNSNNNINSSNNNSSNNSSSNNSSNRLFRIRKSRFRGWTKWFRI